MFERIKWLFRPKPFLAQDYEGAHTPLKCRKCRAVVLLKTDDERGWHINAVSLGESLCPKCVNEQKG